MTRTRILLAVLFVLSLVPAAPALATPVCTDGYKGGPPLALCGGRVFPEAINSVDYVQMLPDPVTGFAEYQHGLEYLAKIYPRWISVFTLRDYYKDGDAVSVGPDGRRSTAANDTGDGHDIVVVKITDHEVPDAGKETLLYSLSIHGDEKGGIEGGVRAAEDLVIAAQKNLEGQSDETTRIVDGIPGYDSTTGAEPNFRSYRVSEVLRNEVVYLVNFNADGWRRGDHFAPTPGLYTRGNQLNTDLNRQMPTVGYIDTRRNPLEESEMLFGHRFMHEVADAGVGGDMAYGADVHGEGQSRAWADIMYPAGQFDSVKHRRLMSIAERTKSVIDDSLYFGFPNEIESETGGDAGEGIEDSGGPSNTVPTKPARWGTVWDTLGYTDTGFLGDYMATELGVTGMDYEIAWNHSDTTRPYGRPWGYVLQENYINSTRAIIKTAMAYAMTERQDFDDFTLDPGGRVGYVYNPDTVTDTDENGIGRLAGPRADGKSANGTLVEQRPYDATNMQFFEDEDRYVKGGFNKALPADIAARPDYLNQFDTLVLADVPLPVDAEGRAVDAAAYYANLRAWVERGGNLVLADRALFALQDMNVVPAGSVRNTNVYQPHSNFVDFEHHMLDGLRGNARQLSEATLIGYGIGNTASPMTIVTRAAWEAAGGHTVGTTGNGASTDNGSQASVGELSLGEGWIRIMGGGLHMPTEQNDHRYGLKDYSLTYSGLYILENSIVHDDPDLGQLPSAVPTTLTLTGSTEGQYSDEVPLGATLVDNSGAPVANSLVTFTLSSDTVSESWTGTTNGQGEVSVPARLLTAPSAYLLTASYEGQPDVYEASQAMTTFVIREEDTSLSLEAVGKGTSSQLVAVLTDADDAAFGIAGATLAFTGDGNALGTAVTDAAGRAVFTLPAQYRGRNHTFGAAFDGGEDPFYLGSSATTSR